MTMTYREARELLTQSGRSANEAQDILDDLAHWGPAKQFRVSVSTWLEPRWLRYAGLRAETLQPEYTTDPKGAGSAPMKDSELGKFVCVSQGGCLHSPATRIDADGVWVRRGGQFSSAHRDCYEATLSAPDDSMPGTLGVISGIMQGIVTKARAADKLDNPAELRDCLRVILADAIRAEEAWSRYISRELPEHN